MEQENEKYQKVLEVLKKAKPVLGSTYQIEETVLDRIERNRGAETDRSDLIGFLFGWTSILWVRRSLIAASVFLVLAFVFQQSIIMKEINHLSRQIESYERDASGMPGEFMEKRMLLLKIPEKRFPFYKKNNTGQQLEELFQTIDQLKKEYKNLDNLIEENPELKKLIEEKLSDITENKINI